MFPLNPPFSPLWFGPHPAGLLADLFVLLKLQQPIARKIPWHVHDALGLSSTISVSFQTRAMPRNFQNLLTRFSLQPSVSWGSPLQEFVPSRRRPCSFPVRGLWPGLDFPRDRSPVISLTQTVQVSLPAYLDGVSVGQHALIQLKLVRRWSHAF